MLFFKKKKAAEKNQDDRNVIETATALINPLIALAEKDAEIIADLKALQEKVKYMIPSSDSKVVSLDKKIQNAISDFKVTMVKKEDEALKKAVADFIRDVEVMIAERNAYWK